MIFRKLLKDLRLFYLLMISAEKNCCDSFDSSLNKVDKWLKTNGLCVNPGKTQIMKFG